MQEFEGERVESTGKKVDVIVGVDGSNLYVAKKKKLVKSPSKCSTDAHTVSQQYNLFKTKLRKEELLTVPIKSIERIEKAIYNEKKFHISYADGHGKKGILDLETYDIAAAIDMIGRLRFISKSIKCKGPQD